MTNFLTQNAKMKRSTLNTWNFAIPAGKTCPQRDICGKGCYAMTGFYNMHNVRAKHVANLEATKKDNFTELMMNEIKYKQAKCVRVHDSGDFYSISYAVKWFTIAARLPHVKFYAYTKCVRDIKDLQLLGMVPSNFTLIYSYGGKEDDHIRPEFDRHSRVFASDEELDKAGYVDASYDDSIAHMAKTKKIGLVYHGAQAKAWQS